MIMFSLPEATYQRIAPAINIAIESFQAQGRLTNYTFR